MNKFLSKEDKCLPQMHLKQLPFTYSACRPFTQNKKIIQQFKPTILTYMPYGDFKNLTRRTASDKRLRYKTFNIA